MTHKLSRTAALVLIAVSCLAADPPQYRLIQRYTLGGDGGWDYVTIDPAARRLYIARATRVMVVDADSGKSVGEIPDTLGVHGVAIVSELGRGFTSNGRDNSATIFDLKTLEAKGKVTTGEGPDAIIYDPASRRVFTFNGRGKSATAIDVADGKVAGTVPLEGRPEFAVADGKGRVYINIEDKSEVAVLDSRKLTVIARWPLAPCEEPTGIALDEAHKRLFAGCRNKHMAVMNTDTGKVVTTVPIGQGVDANAFDPATQLAFASNWDGTLTVVHEDSPDKYTVVTNVATELGARTMALDPNTHQIYLITAKLQNPEKDRRTIVPGSFELLVVGTQGTTPPSK
jgi:DNA-binding beta-propeller fold protein YncE